jgi:hypothetical protein
MDVRGDWMQTHGGGAFYPLDPAPEDIFIEDIGAGLSKLCRYTGQVRYFWSVAEHCLFGAWYGTEDPELRQLFLLHDAAEAYVQDLPPAVKALLPRYREIENKIQWVIWSKYGLWEAFQRRKAEVKEIDMKMRATEKRDLMAPSTKEWADLVGIDPYERRIENPDLVHDYLGVARAFIRTFEFLRTGGVDLPVDQGWAQGRD